MFSSMVLGGVFDQRPFYRSALRTSLLSTKTVCAIDTFNEKRLGQNLKNGTAHIFNCKHRLRVFFSYGLIENWYLIGNSPQYQKLIINSNDLKNSSFFEVFGFLGLYSSIIYFLTRKRVL